MSSINTLLTRDEVADLTGTSTKMGQRNVLTRNGIRHIVRKDGWPAVTWYQVNHPVSTLEVQGSDAEPDFGALMDLEDAHA